ncbi:MAG: ribosome biogenesis GTP-binding protein YihA/YsxC [Bacteroidia bacterium]|nr:ribosome biogenesis GTP-binding protein YihA/YsxC [Bacteroidia bacterium]
MKITSAVYLKSSARTDQCPKPDKPEFAFIGRSNVGKSSLINMLTGYSGLAKVSARPGKTQLINHFTINESWYLVDLPGYGYAKVSKDKRTEFDRMISHYITTRPNLMNVFVLMDIRIPPQESDMNFIAKLGAKNIVFSIVFTKCDKLGTTTLNKNFELYKKRLLEDWEELPLHFFSSAEEKTGRKEILNFISDTIKLYNQ